jgi:NADPH-dependent glutamate synthase beta subunit-like oxidoreductase
MLTKAGNTEARTGTKQQQWGRHSSNPFSKQEETIPWSNTQEAIETTINRNNRNDYNNNNTSSI